ncbi:nuclease-related domain-containing protein [Clostridioides difficile]
MAVIINEKNHLENDYKKYKKKAIIWITATLAFFCGFGIYGYSQTTNFESPFPGILIFMLGFLITGLIAKTNVSRVNALKSGLTGENKAKSIFEKLSNDYYVLNDLSIEIEGKTSQIDNIVVGSNGVFVIETKNINGHIVGDSNSNNITQHKVGRKGGEYSRTMYNPIKQVGTQVYRVSELLKKSNINIWVQGVVFFTNYQCEVELQSNKIPVFSIREDGENEILKYISSYENNNSTISIKTKEEIVSILSKYCIRENGVINEAQNIDIFTTLGSN